MGALYEWEPPQFDEDGTFAQFQQDLASIGLVPVPGQFYGEAVQLLRDVLWLTKTHSRVTLGNMAHVLGTGMHAGVFGTYVSWLLQWGLFMRDDRTVSEAPLFVLGPYGEALLKGFAIFGVDVDRWRAMPTEEDA